MGIPAFYRWLAEKYPLSVVDVVEENPAAVNGVYVPIDTSKPNPNGVEFDNLYLDMNGIIHPCFHHEDLPAPETYDEVFEGVFKYIDRIFSMIRPRKLLYMAIDGVAPRAKMNQQRARRFRAAKDAADEAGKGESVREVGGEKNTKLDSNVITPGTTFMELLSSALRYYIHLRMNSDPGWRGIKVILSDANVPGEGEHKIMSYIRLQRNLPGFDPNTRHCLYGLDADLIMLALATHEVHFSVLREDIRKGRPTGKGSKQGKFSSCLNRKRKRAMSRQGEEYVKYLEDFISEQRFQFLNIWVLRDYLAYELRIPDPAVKFDLEQLIDDFVFMCLFVGNDFLPHVPSLEISEGAIDLLLMVYKKEFSQMGGYLTDSSKVDLERVERFVQAVGAHEDGIFRKRNQARKEWEKILQRFSVTSSARGVDKSTNHVHSEPLNSVDKVKLGEEGWKERYYRFKFEVEENDECERVKRDAVLKYVEGICWVMHYYYQGVCSWQWFYPYHYAPFASDFQGLNKLEINFVIGKPFKPFDQLMGVLPAASAQALPLFYRKLMTDPLSPISDFYPSDFELDMNGRTRAWQAVCKLPFIEESRLLSEIEKVEHTLTDDEKQRNTLGLDMLFVHKSHPLAAKIFSFCKRYRNNPKLPEAKVKGKIDPEFSDGMNGYMYSFDKPVCPGEILSPIDDMELITNNEVVSVFYEFPSFHSHVAKPPEGVIFPGKSVSEHDVEPPHTLWHEKTAISKSRVCERRIPRRSVSGPCLAKYARQLVLQNCLTGQKDSHVDGERDNNSEVRKRKRDVPDDKIAKKKKKKKNRNKRRENNSEVRTREQNCQAEQKVSYVDRESENNSEVSKGEQNCQVDQKDSYTDGLGEKNSEVKKAERDIPGDKTAKKKKKKRKKNRNKRRENNFESRTTEENCQAEQRESNADGESENNSEVRKREQNCQADQKVSNADGESGNNSEVSKGEHNCHADQKDSNTDGRSVKNSEVRNGERDSPDDKTVKKKQEKNNRKKRRENNFEVRTSEQNGQAEQKNSNADGESENNSEVRKREQNCQADQKGSKADGSSEKNTEGRTGEREIPDDKIGKKKKKKKKKSRNKRRENNSEVATREQNCQAGQKDSNADGESENNSEVRKREQNCQADQKDGKADGDSEKSTEGRTRERESPDDKIGKKKKKNRNKRRKLNKANAASIPET